MAESVTVGITGAAGYIGSCVATTLLDAGHDLVLIDNFRDPKVEAIHDEPILDIDVRDREALRETFADVDAIMHLAAVSGVVDCGDHPTESFDVNVGGTENVAWLCREWGTPLIFPASMAVIGDPIEFPITTNHPRAPLNLYGRTKQMSEDDIHALAEDAFPALILLKSNLYGRHTVDSQSVGKRTVINIFVEQALEGGPLTVHEPGTQARDFIHVEDVAVAYARALEYLLEAPNGAETVPIASGDCRSVLTIAETVQRVMEEERGEHIEIDLIPNPRAAETATEDFTVDTDAARERIGFSAEHNIEVAVRRIVGE